MGPSIVVCSSFRFYPAVLRLQRQLEQAGYRCEIPLPNELLDPDKPWMLRDGADPTVPAHVEKEWRQIETHLERIRDTDIVVVYCGSQGDLEQGYVGLGVSSEMGFAHRGRIEGVLDRPRTVLSTSVICDTRLRGYVDELVSPDEMARRLSSQTW